MLGVSISRMSIEELRAELKKVQEEEKRLYGSVRHVNNFGKHHGELLERIWELKFAVRAYENGNTKHYMR